MFNSEEIRFQNGSKRRILSQARALIYPEGNFLDGDDCLEWNTSMCPIMETEMALLTVTFEREMVANSKTEGRLTELLVT